MDTLHLRAAQQGDLPQIAALLLKSYQEFKQVLEPGFWTKMEGSLQDTESLSQLLEKGHCFLSLIAHQVVGVIFLMPSGNPTTIYPANWAYIRLLGVDPDQRGKGIGNRLTGHVIEVAAKNGEKLIGLHTSTIMPAARRIYEGFGFKIVRQLDPIMGQEYWLYLKELG
ncbi:GNAT family N-acetyltransferase [Chitinophaga silvatica]|uniref:GNAT family N-acetyltransferase n=1 Tax=Chitinophaga silvatica TaxID=2282649 RepID=A0A3E1YB94_9BACT|nr:GNAT family N-acetyltransferase [Chitinophaga silvatica]RFS23259.1 GNAT family N-acetyltransferase [Chitinophaga silvatica]